MPLKTVRYFRTQVSGVDTSATEEILTPAKKEGTLLVDTILVTNVNTSNTWFSLFNTTGTDLATSATATHFEVVINGNTTAQIDFPQGLPLSKTTDALHAQANITSAINLILVGREVEVVDGE